MPGAAKVEVASRVGGDASVGMGCGVSVFGSASMVRATTVSTGRRVGIDGAQAASRSRAREAKTILFIDSSRLIASAM
jgi:hypothetical protein